MDAANHPTTREFRVVQSGHVRFRGWPSLELQDVTSVGVGLVALGATEYLFVTYMDNVKVEELEVNGVNYVRKDSVQSSSPAQTLDGLRYVIVRTYSAGVFAGYLSKREGKEVALRQARRMWYWDGAASLSQLAIDGTSKPKSCKFPQEVETIELTEAIEILDVTEKARLSIASVPVWTA